MVINNFDQIGGYLLPRTKEGFYLCQIIKRGKDFIGVADKTCAVKDNGLIATYYLKDTQDLERHRDIIKLLCDENGARAYVNVSFKTNETFQALMLQEIANKTLDKQFISPRNVSNSIAGKVYDKEYVWWLVDVDDKNP